MQVLRFIHLLNYFFNPLSANFIKWSNTLKQFVATLPTNYLSVFDHFCGIGTERANKKLAITFSFVELLYILIPVAKYILPYLGKNHSINFCEINRKTLVMAIFSCKFTGLDFYFYLSLYSNRSSSLIFFLGEFFRIAIL